MEKVEERGTEEAQGPVLDLEMTEALDSPDKEPERDEDHLETKGELERLRQPNMEAERLQEETEADRLKRKRTEQEGRKLMEESIEKVLKGPASERAGDKTFNVQGTRTREGARFTGVDRSIAGRANAVWGGQRFTPQSSGVARKAPTATQMPPELSPKTSPGPSL
jgi:hypothetical protein